MPLLVVDGVMSGVIDSGRYNVVYVVYYESFVVLSVDDNFAPSSQVIRMLFSNAVCQRSNNSKHCTAGFPCGGCRDRGGAEYYSDRMKVAFECFGDSVSYINFEKV